MNRLTDLCSAKANTKAGDDEADMDAAKVLGLEKQATKDVARNSKRDTRKQSNLTIDTCKKSKKVQITNKMVDSNTNSIAHAAIPSSFQELEGEEKAAAPSNIFKNENQEKLKDEEEEALVSKLCNGASNPIVSVGTQSLTSEEEDTDDDILDEIEGYDHDEGKGLLKQMQVANLYDAEVEEAEPPLVTATPATQPPTWKRCLSVFCTCLFRFTVVALLAIPVVYFLLTRELEPRIASSSSGRYSWREANLLPHPVLQPLSNDFLAAGMAYDAKDHSILVVGSTRDAAHGESDCFLTKVMLASVGKQSFGLERNIRQRVRHSPNNSTVAISVPEEEEQALSNSMKAAWTNIYGTERSELCTAVTLIKVSPMKESSSGNRRLKQNNNNNNRKKNKNNKNKNNGGRGGNRKNGGNGNGGNGQNKAENEAPKELDSAEEELGVAAHNMEMTKEDLAEVEGEVEDIEATEEAGEVEDIEATEEAEKIEDIEATEEAGEIKDIGATEEAGEIKDIGATEEAEEVEDLEATEEALEVVNELAEEQLENAQEEVGQVEEYIKETDKNLGMNKYTQEESAEDEFVEEEENLKDLEDVQEINLDLEGTVENQQEEGEEDTMAVVLGYTNAHNVLKRNQQPHPLADDDQDNGRIYGFAGATRPKPFSSEGEQNTKMESSAHWDGKLYQQFASQYPLTVDTCANGDIVLAMVFTKDEQQVSVPKSHPFAFGDESYRDFPPYGGKSEDMTGIWLSRRSYVSKDDTRSERKENKVLVHQWRNILTTNENGRFTKVSSVKVVTDSRTGSEVVVVAGTTSGHGDAFGVVGDDGESDLDGFVTVYNATTGHRLFSTRISGTTDGSEDVVHGICVSSSMKKKTTSTSSSSPSPSNSRGSTSGRDSDSFGSSDDDDQAQVDAIYVVGSTTSSVGSNSASLSDNVTRRAFVQKIELSHLNVIWTQHLQAHNTQTTSDDETVQTDVEARGCTVSNNGDMLHMVGVVKAGGQVEEKGTRTYWQSLSQWYFEEHVDKSMKGNDIFLSTYNAKHGDLISSHQVKNAGKHDDLASQNPILTDQDDTPIVLGTSTTIPDKQKEGNQNEQKSTVFVWQPYKNTARKKQDVSMGTMSDMDGEQDIGDDEEGTNARAPWDEQYWSESSKMWLSLNTYAILAVIGLVGAIFLLTFTILALRLRHQRKEQVSLLDEEEIVVLKADL